MTTAARPSHTPGRLRWTGRLTQYAHGGGCACKIPAAELEAVLGGLAGSAIGGPDAGNPAATGAGPAPGTPLLGLADGDDAAVVRLNDDQAVISTADFFTPVVDDAYDWGRIAAANALSDVYAVGGRPVMAINLLGWPRDTLPMEVAGEVLRGGRDLAARAGCPVAGGHSIDDPEPKYGMAVTGVAHPDRLLRLDQGRPGMPLSLTKPLGIGVLNTRHKATGERFAEAIEAMTTLNAEAAEIALERGSRCATDVTGFGLLGHLFKLARASRVAAVIDTAAIPLLEGARAAVRDGFVSGGTRRNLAWVTPHTDFGRLPEEQRLLMADAQTSGGLLVAGEIPGAPVIGELIEPGDRVITVR